MLTAWARRTFRSLLETIARGFARLGLTPNQLTLSGLLLQAGVAIVIARGYLALAGWLLIASAVFDAFDGTLARLTGQSSRFGAFLDATLDRYAEVLTLGGLLWYVSATGSSRLEVLLIYAALAGSLLVSYTRAKAESLQIACNEGLLTRAERVALLVLGLLLAHWQPLAQGPRFLTLILFVLAILSNVTALQRIIAVYRSTHGERSPS
ncbi:MAG: CDP-alcohol phosphatidyltransferase family protein [Caldilineales bacterium]